MSAETQEEGLNQQGQDLLAIAKNAERLHSLLGALAAMDIVKNKNILPNAKERLDALEEKSNAVFMNYLLVLKELVARETTHSAFASTDEDKGAGGKALTEKERKKTKALAQHRKEMDKYVREASSALSVVLGVMNDLQYDICSALLAQAKKNEKLEEHDDEVSAKPDEIKKVSRELKAEQDIFPSIDAMMKAYFGEEEEHREETPVDKAVEVYLHQWDQEEVCEGIKQDKGQSLVSNTNRPIEAQLRVARILLGGCASLAENISVPLAVATREGAAAREF